MVKFERQKQNSSPRSVRVTRIEFPEVLIELRPSRIDGVGVFAVSSLSGGQRVAAGLNKSDYRRLVPWHRLKDYGEAVRNKVETFCIGTPNGFIPPDRLDFNRLSVEWYLNHSCEGNVGFDKNGDFVARTAIARGDELTYDYALAESNPRFKMMCKCGASHCRHVITGNDWKDSAFRERNLNYMLPRLRRSAIPAVVTNLRSPRANRRKSSG